MLHNSCHSFSLKANMVKAEEEKEEELHYASITIVELEQGKMFVHYRKKGFSASENILYSM